MSNQNLSGAGAAPDGDQMVNLWKYYLGLPGRTPAPSSRFPSGALLFVTNTPFLSMNYTCDALANDVTFLPQVSPDLLNWFSGPTFTRIERVQNLGALENITIRSLSPVPSAQEQFLRLLLQRTGL
jgi:hypothetical protein